MAGPENMKSGILVIAIISLSVLVLVLPTVVSSSVSALTQSTAISHSKFSFRDDFNYANLNDLQAAGWALCGGGAPLSQTSIGNSVINLTNDGITGAAICYSNIPSKVNSWTVSALGRWIGNPYGSIEILVKTSSHVYRWDADGFFNQFILLRDDVIVFRQGGYTPQLDQWHTLRLDANSKTGLSFFFDGQQIGTFQDVARTDYALNQITVLAGYLSIESWDWISAATA